MALRRQGVVLGGEAIIIPLQGDIRSLDVLVSPEAGATALVEYTASDHFVGATKQVGVSQSAPVATFIAPDSLSLADFAAHGITKPGQVFQILGTASNDGFYRILEFLSGPSSPGAAGSQFVASGSVYSINARDFPTGEADSDNFTVSFWIKQPSEFADGGSFIKSIITSLRNTVPEPGFAGSTPYGFNIAKSPPTSLSLSSNPLGFLLGVNEGFADSWPGDGLWHHILISADISLGTAHIFVDGVDEEAFQVLIPGSIQWEDPSDHLTHSIGGTHQRLLNGEVAAVLDAELSEIYFDPQNYLDFTIQSNRELFRTAGGDPVNLGPTGAIPTTAQPAVYCPDGDPAGNVGRWGPYTLVSNSTPSQTPVVSTVGPALDTARVLPIDGGMINEDAAPDVGVFSGPSAGAASIWVPWDPDAVTVETQSDVPSSSTALMLTATAGDVEFTINGGKARSAAAPAIPNPPLGAREWDGATWNRFTGVSGVADGRVGTCSFWMNVPDVTVVQGGILLAGGDSPELALGLTYDSVNNQIILLLKGVGSSSTRMTFVSNKVVPGQWQHVIMSWEHTFPIDSAAHMTMYIDGVQITTGGGDIIDQINIDEDLNYQTGSWTQGQQALGFPQTNPLDGCLSEFYFNTDERIDITLAANREQFRSASGDAVNIGGDGSGPTGSQPAFYAANGELNPNAGYVPDLPVIAGEVLNCATVPTKVAPPFIATAREWDGATRNRRSGSVPTGVTDTRTGILSFWVNADTIGTPEDLIMMCVDQIGGGAIGLQLRRTNFSGGKIVMNMATTSGASAITMNNGGTMIVDTWHHFLYAWEYIFPADSAANFKLYFDGVQQLDGVGGANITQGSTDEDIGWAARGNAWTQGSAGANFDGGGFGGPRFFDGCLSNFYLNIDEHLDITIQANREKFRDGSGNPVFLGADGSIPTGNQPAFYAANGELNTNDGYAEDLPVITGAVTDCADAP